jgi:hypothetical protein
LISAAFFLLPLYVMMITSLKGMPEIRQGNLLAPPNAPTIAAWIKAWSSACTGLSCDGIQVGFLNSVTIMLPSVTMSIAAGALTGYAYLLDFSNSPVNSCATYGASFAGTTKLSADVSFTYRAEAATQSDYGASTLNYATRYSVFEAGLAGKPATFLLGYEVLGSDHNVGFKTPLASLHPFNGWADLFLTTPAAGLRDTYAKATGNLPAECALVACYHQFDSDAGSLDFGHELDLSLSRKFGPRVTALVKYADFHRNRPTYPNVQKVWAQVDFVY